MSDSKEATPAIPSGGAAAGFLQYFTHMTDGRNEMEKHFRFG